MAKQRNIKEYRPSRQSRYKQGYVNMATCHKLFESQQNKPIIYRSSYELRFMEWCERSSSVRRWGSECVAIKYTNPIDRTIHTYYPDFLLEMTDGRIFLVEIKAHNQTVAPKGGNPTDYQHTEYVRNVAKWTAAKKFCERNGMEFKIFTERTIMRL